MKYANAALCLIACALGWVACAIRATTQASYCQVSAEQSTGSTPIVTGAADVGAELAGLLPAPPNKPSTEAPGDAVENAAADPPLPNIVSSIIIDIERNYVPIDRIRGLLIKVTNQSKFPVLVNCDAATAIVLPSNGNTRNAATVKNLELVENPKMSFGQLLKADTEATLMAGFTVGAVPAIKGIKIQHSPYLYRYGKDEQRRQIEAGRFGKRLLWPDETSSGTVFFKTDEPLSGAVLKVPVSLPFIGSSAAQNTQTVSTRIKD